MFLHIMRLFINFDTIDVQISSFFFFFFFFFLFFLLLDSDTGLDLIKIAVSMDFSS